MSYLNIIACVNEEGIIGRDNDLFAKCSEDMKRFKKITIGSGKNVVIMGRKTWESIPRGYKPLPERINIVISKNEDYECVGAIVCTSFQNALKCCNEKIIDEIFVIGGETLYDECFKTYTKIINRIYLTKIHKKSKDYHLYKYLNFDDENYTLLKSEEKRETVKILDSDSRYVEYECPVSYEVYSPTEKVDEFQYLKSLKEVFEDGSVVQGRNGKTFSKFGMRMEYDLDRFPLLTTKKMGYKTILKELIWFLNGQTDNEILKDQNVHIWDGNSTREFLDGRGLNYPEGDLGPVYGFQWRHFGAHYRGSKENYDGPAGDGGFDQIKYILNEIKTNPTSRRIILSAWNPPDLEKMALPPCHVLSQYYVDVEKGTLSCQLYQRSGDMFLGVPYNIASYSFLTYIFAHLTGYKPGKLIHIIGDAHIYEEHIEAVHKQLTRTPKLKPKVTISGDLKDIDDVRVEHFILEDYESHEAIKAPMIA